MVWLKHPNGFAKLFRSFEKSFRRFGEKSTETKEIEAEKGNFLASKNVQNKSN